MLAAALRAREGWKYRMLEEYLQRRKLAHTFEFPLGGYVFDLALHDAKVLVEFDGHYHSAKMQSEVDGRKEAMAAKEGWAVHRVETKDDGPIRPSAIRAILEAVTELST